MTAPPKRPPLSSAFRFALDGLLRTLVEERNMKIHWVCALAVVMVGMALPLAIAPRVALLFGLLLVLVLEVLNAALEGVVDLATGAWSYPAKVAKDAAAGAVLVMAGGSAVVLTDVLVHAWSVVEANPDAVLWTVGFGVPCLLGLALTVGLPHRLKMQWATTAGLSLAFFVPLAWCSEDPVFAGLGSVLILLAFVARAREPALTSRAPPPRGLPAR